MANAKILKERLTACGLQVFGGDNAPYIWMRTPDKTKSWKFFDRLLYETAIAGTPGVGFGPSGEGYFRFTAFGSRQNTEEAAERLKKWL
jgi:LL-diaminopimelate aminotransferase